MKIISTPSKAAVEVEDPELDNPGHNQDDYEEMEGAGKRDSFTDEGPDDIYQNY